MALLIPPPIVVKSELAEAIHGKQHKQQQKDQAAHRVPGRKLPGPLRELPVAAAVFLPSLRSALPPLWPLWHTGVSVSISVASGKAGCWQAPGVRRPSSENPDWPGRSFFAFPLCHPAGRMFPAAASCVAGQPPGSGLGCKLGFMGSFHAHIFMLNLDVFCCGHRTMLRLLAPRTAFFASPGGFFAARLACVLSSFSRAFPAFPRPVFRFCLCFWNFSLLLRGLLGEALRLLCLAGILRPARFILLPHAVRGTAFPAVLLKLAAFGLRAIMARRTVLPCILVLKPQASGWCGGRPFPFSRSGAIAPGILSSAPAFENSVCPVSFR